MALLDKVRQACRVTTGTFDGELTDLIREALADIGITDVDETKLVTTTTDPLIEQAVKTYCKINFGYATLSNDQYARLKASYDEQKSQLLMSSKYTNWGDPNA